MTHLQRHMGLAPLILMGVGGTVGAGIFVLTGTIAARYAGPGVALSFLIAAAACACVSLCYAELASMIPVAGSAYTYSYAAMGEVVAWIVGWNLVLEYMFAAAAVAIGWSGYFETFLQQWSITLPRGSVVNLPAALIVLAVTVLLTRDLRSSAKFNAGIVTLKIAVILTVVLVGMQYVDPRNWHPFVPPSSGAAGEFGWSGLMRGAAVAFFSYIGFDMVAASAQEVRDPKRNLPLGLFITLGVCTVLYMAMALVLTGLISYRELDVPQPLSVAIAHAGAGMAWLAPLVSGSLVICLSAGIFLAVYGQSRVCYAMGKDGLIPSVFCRLSARSRTPVLGTWIVGAVTALIAATVPLPWLGEFVSIGTLMAFAIVCIGVLVLRRKRPDAPRAFRVPAAPLVASLGAGICLYLMASLPWVTWVRLAAWFVLGSLIYGFYGRKNAVPAGRNRC